MRACLHKFDPNDDIDLGNPYSKISCLILYLYSMELGSPPLYYEINRVCRQLDLRYLKTLGPYILALSIVTSIAEQNRDIDDKIRTGEIISRSSQFNLAGLFILYRGLPMSKQLIDQYCQMIDPNQAKFNCARQSGNFSCS